MSGVTIDRPIKYTPEHGDLICEQIGRKKSLASICDSNDKLPSARTVYRWLREHDEFCQNYARAKEDQADYLAEEILDIADDLSIDPKDRKLQIDARKWLASKFKPKKYGDKIQQDHTSSDGTIAPRGMNDFYADIAKEDENK